MGNCYYIPFTPATRALCLFDDCLQTERGREITKSYPLSHNSLWIAIIYLSVAAHFGGERLDPEESSLSVPNLGPCCILLLGWHNCNFKGK